MDPEVAEFGRLLQLRKGGGSHRRIRIVSVHEPPAIMQNFRLSRSLTRTESFIDREERIRFKDLDKESRSFRASLQSYKEKEKEIRLCKTDAKRDEDLLLSKRETLHLRKTLKQNLPQDTTTHLPDINNGKYLVTDGFRADSGKRKGNRERSVTLAQMEDISERVDRIELDLSDRRKRRTGLSMLYARTTYV